MDAISYSYADKQAKRIKKFNENPDSASGILTQPSTIQAGETVSIPAGRTAIMANTVIDGTITLDGTMFIPSGATTDDIDAQLALKAPLENPAFTSAISTKDVNYKSTPVSITSWSYVTTTITLNVASHTFVAGDYIEVSGLTSTTYPANGVHLITSVTATTIVFTLGAIPTGTAGVSSATVKGYVTINGLVNKSIGVGQLYKNVTSSRIPNVAYFNTTRQSIMVTVNIVSASNLGFTTALIVDGIGGTSFNVYADQAGRSVAITVLVPPGSAYSLNPITNGSVSSWVELR